jgi:hypothetical protein
VNDPVSIGRLRARLLAQVAAPLVVTAAGRQYVFDEDSAAYAEIAVQRGEGFALVVVIGSLPSEQFVVDVWHRFAKEVWLVDTRDETVHVARVGEPERVVDRSGTLRSSELPGFAVAVAALFAPPS